MAHSEQQAFCLRLKALLPRFFNHVLVTDFGSLDINGSNRELFTDSSYLGVDIYRGKNVDVVCKAHAYEPAGPQDVVISTEMLEHDEDWWLSLRRMYEILRPGGLMLTTCATTGRGEHGTRTSSPGDSPGTPDYYRNLTQEDFENALPLEWFKAYGFEVNHSTRDLYFWGIKRELDLPDVRTAEAA